jgi:CBS domain-containing protein
MATSIREVMTAAPVAVPSDLNLVEAARTMREFDIGDLVVTHDGGVCGIVTDRDITIRAIAESRDPKATTLADICSRELVTVGPDQPIDVAVRLMRERAVRRLPVVQDGEPVGVVTLGDLALERDPESALAEITAADPNQ